MHLSSLEHLAQAHRAQADTVAELLRGALRSAEELTDLHVAVARNTLRTASEHYRKPPATNDIAALTALGIQAAELGATRWSEYLRGLQGIMTRLHEDSAATLRAHCEAVAESTSAAAHDAAERLPGGEVLTTAIRSVLQASRKSLDDASSMARQLTIIANANQAAANAAKAVRAPAKGR